MKTSIVVLALLCSFSFHRAIAVPPQRDGAAPQSAGTAEKPKVTPYPLDICIVSDEKLGEMGKPVVFVHQGQEIKLCCKPCRKQFDKEPAKYLKKLEPKK